jgi:hypothetical protein
MSFWRSVVRFMAKRRWFVAIAVIISCGTNGMTKEPLPANYEESKIPAYTLPDPFVTRAGEKISTPAEWFEKRRPEILGLFAEHVYGTSPGFFSGQSYRVLQENAEALDGKAVHKVIRIDLSSGASAPYLAIHLYLPKERKAPSAVFVGVNLFDRTAPVPKPGGQVVPAGRKIPEGLDPKMLVGDETIFRILERGYGIATFHPGDVSPDDAKTYTRGVIGLANGNKQTRSPSEWGSLGAWAWGISRCVDYLANDPMVDSKRIIAIGHSRNGKAALWAGAQDERIAAVISNQSGCGGAALSKRRFGETVALINKRFPHWFCERFRDYDDRESELPVDQHLLLAAIAPRPVHVGSAEGDGWADPRGEFQSVVHASPVFERVGAGGLTVTEFPPVNSVVGDRLAYHCRSGQHSLADYDWMVYLDWCDRLWPKP